MTRHSNTTVFVVLESSDGSFGIGEALPRKYVTGEDPLDIVNTLRAPLERLVGCSVEEAWDLLPTLCIPLLSVRGGLGARCAMELACLDLLSKSSKIPVADVLKLEGQCVDTPSVTATLPLLPRWLMKVVIRAFLFAGAKDFKVKLLGDRARDTEILDCVSQTTNRDSDIRVDLNMALSFAEGVPYLEWLASRYDRLTWIEEPLSPTDRHHMPQLQRHFADRFTFDMIWRF
jgi:L-alanine-DL-glutamate epimerase-like enolase superfamily enzyme